MANNSVFLRIAIVLRYAELTFEGSRGGAEGNVGAKERLWWWGNVMFSALY